MKAVEKFPRLNAYPHDKDVSRERLEEYAEKLIEWASDAEDLLVELFREKVELKDLDKWMLDNGKRLYELETMLKDMQKEWAAQERSLDDFQELWVRAVGVKAFLMNLLLEKGLVPRKQLSELLETKRKEWKIAYPLKSQEDFNYRVLIDEIFDELVKELLVGSVGVEPENKKEIDE
jgi:hypothetical protein